MEIQVEKDFASKRSRHIGVAFSFSQVWALAAFHILIKTKKGENDGYPWRDQIKAKAFFGRWA